MSNPEQKQGENDAEKNNRIHFHNEENDNLGLDADHSSDDNPYAYLNNDNDRVSHNPDGEDDDRDTLERPGHSPLEDK